MGNMGEMVICVVLKVEVTHTKSTGLLVIVPNKALSLSLSLRLSPPSSRRESWFP